MFVTVLVLVMWGLGMDSVCDSTGVSSLCGGKG